MPRPRSPLKSLAAMLDRSEAMVALFDQQRRLVYASAACGQWLGVDVQSLIGCKAIYASEPAADSADAALARLAPPPDALAGKPTQTTIVTAAADGQIKRRRARFLPVPLEAEEFAVLLVAEADDLSGDEVDSKLSSRADWHAALATNRAQLPANMQGEYLIGNSPAMRRLREQVHLASRSRARVVVVGPRGSGTQAVAATIHALGARRGEGLVTLHSPLQDAETIQAAIRALSRQRVGPGERGPAILLRDVHLLPPPAQQELLGFLQLPGFDLQTLATCRVSLVALAKKEKFSPELAAILTTLELRVPPLADRPEDVPLLTQLFVERANKAGKQLSGLVPEAVEELIAYRWPENVDELAEVMAAACEKGAGPWIIVSDLSERVRGNWHDLAHPRRDVETIDLDAFLADVEKDLLQRALAQSRGNKSEAARLLGVSRPRLLRRLVQLGLAAKEDAIDFQPLAGEREPLGDAS